MKARYYFLLLTSMLLIAACDKNLEVNVPSFDVSGYEVVDALDSVGNPVKKVTFDVQGNSDVITFYSGETLRQYEFKDGRLIKTDGLTLSFDYNASSAVGSVVREDQISILYSTDFDGNVNATGVNAANWEDITTRFALKQVKDISSRTSTSASIADLAVKDKPLYVAFRYTTPPQTTALRYSTWDFFSIAVSQQTILGSTDIVTQSESPFPLYFSGPNDEDTPGRSARSISNSTRLRFRGNILSSNFADTAKVWAISPAIIIGNDFDLGPDRPISIKNRVAPALKSYSYNYTKPGTYKVAFVAVNVTTKGTEEVVKELEIVVP